MSRREEIARQRRVADQMITIYSALRDRYARRATTLTLGTCLSGIILATATFLQPSDVRALSISEGTLRLLMGLSAAVVFSASVSELVLRWRERSQSYHEAATRLSRVKAEAREAMIAGDEVSEAVFKELSSKFNGAMQGLPGIPDRQFVALKAYHMRKVRLSQMCDERVGCPVWFLRLQLWVSGIVSSLGRGRVPK